MLIKFSKKIFIKEWRKLLLPFFSVVLTALVISVSYFLVSSAKEFLESKNKEFLGGDVVFESGQIFSIDPVLDSSKIQKQSSTIDFNGLLSSSKNDSGKTSAVNIEVVDQNFPLYGKYELKNSEYTYPNQNEVYLDQNVSETLAVYPGDIVYFNNTSFVVKDIILEDPSSLFSGFNFFGKAIFSMEALSYANVDLNLFRKEYQTKIILNQKLSDSEKELIRSKAREFLVQTRFDTGGGGFSFGLEIVEKFLVVAILIISVLSLVNIYASVNYLGRRLRRDFAILIAIGMKNNNIYKILLLVNIAVITLGTIIGIILGYISTNLIEKYITTNFNLPLVNNAGFSDISLLAGAIIITGIFATLPVMSRLKKISPRELLAKEGSETKKQNIKNVLLNIVGILPIALFSVYFLNDFFVGMIVVGLIISIYVLVMIFYKKLIDIFYKYRKDFRFSNRMIIAQKKFDGFFGLISFASLFVALVAIFSLSVVRASIEKFLLGDLQGTLPDSYVIDIQNSQKDPLLAEFPELNLFPNVRARILKIDELNVQSELDKENPGIDRELGREFNLTYRTFLLPSEKNIAGSFDMENGGQVSVEKEFADRANIKMNSQLVFLIQGFEIPVRVTSLRESDTRSGLPFFYFILSPADLERFPATYFGYSNLSKERQSELSAYLTKNIPNASVVNTRNITELAERIIRFLIIIILMITIPPLLLSAFLIITILATSAKERKRDGARMMALGFTMKFVRNYYVIESMFTAILASVLAYIISALISNFLILKFLDIKSTVYFERISLYVFLFTILLLFLISIIMWRSGRKSLREYLNYEENN